MKLLNPVLFIVALSLCGEVMSDSSIVKKHQLSKCSDKPNCVSTLDSRDQHRINPIQFTGDYINAKKKLLKILHSLPRIKVISNNEQYLQLTQTSLIFRFVDDIEFLFDEEKKEIHFFSMSRVGHSDFGVNRKRMENIRRIFEQ